MSASATKPNYGLDAPAVVRRFGIIGTLLLFIASAIHLCAGNSLPRWTQAFVPPFVSIGIAFVLQAALMIWGSKVGKLRLREKILNSIPWRGDEQVLDVGCGHGLMLIGAARRLKTGKAV